MTTERRFDPGEGAEAWARQLAAEWVYFDLEVIPAGGEYRASITPQGTRRTFRLASIDADRTLVETLGIGTPADFRPEPLVQGGRGRRMKALAEEFNLERMRWVSDVELRPGEPYLLRIPATRQEAGFGRLVITFAWLVEGGGGGSLAKHLPIGLADPREARRAMDRWHEDRRLHERFVGPLPEPAPRGDYGSVRAQTTPFAGGRLPPRRARESTDG